MLIFIELLERFLQCHSGYAQNENMYKRLSHDFSKQNYIKNILKVTSTLK